MKLTEVIGVICERLSRGCESGVAFPIREKLDCLEQRREREEQGVGINYVVAQGQELTRGTAFSCGKP